MTLIQLQQLPSLLNQPPLPPPSFPPRSQPLGATRLSIGSSAQQPLPPPPVLAPVVAPAVEPYNSSFGVSFAAPSGGAPSATAPHQPPAGTAQGNHPLSNLSSACRSLPNLVRPSCIASIQIS
jgi:hypothetical protein